MKKIILLFTLTSVLSFAQNLKYGIKGGLNVSNQSYNFSGAITPTNNSSLIGFNIGGYTEYKISNRFYIQPELLFSIQGGQFNDIIYLRLNFNDPGEYVDVKQVNYLSYINIPIMAKYFIVKKFNIELGPQFGFLISSRSKTSYNSPTHSMENLYDNKDFFNSIDYGINLGSEYHVSNKISLGLRYYLGIKNVGKNTNEIKNNVLSISTSYNF